MLSNMMFLNTHVRGYAMSNLTRLRGYWLKFDIAISF